MSLQERLSARFVMSQRADLKKLMLKRTYSEKLSQQREANNLTVLVWWPAHRPQMRLNVGSQSWILHTRVSSMLASTETATPFPKLWWSKVTLEEWLQGGATWSLHGGWPSCHIWHDAGENMLLSALEREHVALSYSGSNPEPCKVWFYSLHLSSFIRNQAHGNR